MSSGHGATSAPWRVAPRHRARGSIGAYCRIGKGQSRVLKYVVLNDDEHLTLGQMTLIVEFLADEGESVPPSSLGTSSRFLRKSFANPALFLAATA